jgi:hypothetical protein
MHSSAGRPAALRIIRSEESKYPLPGSSGPGVSAGIEPNPSGVTQHQPLPTVSTLRAFVGFPL